MSTIDQIAHDLEPEKDEIQREDLAKLAKPIANSLEEFLQAFVTEKLDTQPLYQTDDFPRPSSNP